MESKNVTAIKMNPALKKETDFIFPAIDFILAPIFQKLKQPPLRIDSGLHFRYSQKMAGGFFRFIFYLIVAYVVYALFRFLFSPRRPSRPGRSQPKLSGTMVKDEVCNTYLAKDEALVEHLDGEDHYFCSPECRSKFLEQRKGRG